MKFTLSGGEDALANLRSIEEAVTDEGLQDEGLKVLEPVAEDARRLAPVDEGVLRDSIQTTIFEDGSVGVIIRDWKGHFFEFGTVKMRATPMLIPAWDAHAGTMGSIFADRIRARIEAPPRINRSRVAIRAEGL